MFHGKIVLKIEGDDDDSETHYYWRNRRIWGGKTSVSRAILDNFPNARISMIEHDSYYKNQSHLTFEERILTNYDHPLAFDTDLMIYHISELLAGRSVDIPIYDYTQHTRSEDLSSGTTRCIYCGRYFSIGRQTVAGFNGY